MLQTLRSNVDLTALSIVLSFFLVVGGVGVWYVRKTTGRPLKDMLAVLGGGIALAALCFSLHSIEPASLKKRTVTNIGFWIFVALAPLVWWAFNKLARPASTKARSRNKRS